MAWLTLAMPREAAEVPRKVQPIISSADEFQLGPLASFIDVRMRGSGVGGAEEPPSWSLILFTLKKSPRICKMNLYSILQQ